MKGRQPKGLANEPGHALNAICPYFTMFPLEVPLNFLQRRSRDASIVFDPFCGRGTTLYAARVRGARGVGIDCSPVAVAISRAKLADFSVEQPLNLARDLLASISHPAVPEGEFWSRAYHSETLRNVCKLRDGLLISDDDHASVVLRAAVLGILHGPITGVQSYLSNQMQRTFAPKPGYALRFWKQRDLTAQRVDILEALKRKLQRIGSSVSYRGDVSWQDVHLADCAEPSAFASVPNGIDAVVTSPPYFGMRTYVPDQWLRHWFLGGPATVDYNYKGDLPSSSTAEFTGRLAQTWSNVARHSAPKLRMLIRFGAIPSRAVDAKALLLSSLEQSTARWRIISIRNAQSAAAGKRQVRHMRNHSAPIDEFDFHVELS